MNEVKLKDLLSLFVKRLWLMILIAVIAMGSVGIYQTFLLTPEYESTATLYILKKENEVSNTYTNSDFSLALDVVNDCTYILKSHAVLDEVIENLELDLSYTTLYHSISTNNPSDTRILEVTVTSTDANLSKTIVDEICKIGTDRITDAMGFKQVSIYENGQVNERPSNKMGLLNYLVVGFIAGVLTYTILLVIFLIDDTLKTKEEIEKSLGISVIGEIPNFKDTKKQGYGKYGYGYGKKGSSSSDSHANHKE